MAIHLLTKRSNSSQYESFFDLIFCCLVTFIVLVLALITSVEDRVESFKEDQVAVSSKLADLAKREESLDITIAEKEKAIRAREAENESLRQQQVRLAEVNQKKDSEIQEKDRVLAESQTRIDALLGTGRLTGGQGKATITFIWDTTKEPIRVWPLPHALTNYSTDYGSTEANKANTRKMRLATMKLIKEIEPMTMADAVDILDAMSAFVVTEVNETPRLGVLLSPHGDGVEIGNVFDDSPYSDAGGGKGEVVLAIDGIRVQGTQPEKIDLITGTLNKLPFGEEVRIDVRLPSGEKTRRMVSLRKFSSTIPTLVEIQSLPTGSLLAEGMLDEDGELVQGHTTDEFARRVKQDRDLLEKMYRRRSIEKLQESIEEVSPVVRVKLDSDQHQLILGKTKLKPKEFQNLLASVSGAPLVIQFESEADATVDWVRSEVLIPSGFVNKSPRSQRGK